MTTSVKPVAGDDRYTFDENQVIGGNMLTNDIAGANGQIYLRDFDGWDVLAKKPGQVTDITGQYGTFHLMADGTWSYTLSDAAKVGFVAGQTLHEAIQYKISDGAGHTDTGLFKLDIKGVTEAQPHPTDVVLNFEDLVIQDGDENPLPDDYHGFSITTPDRNAYVILAGFYGNGYDSVSQEKAAAGQVGYNPSGEIPMTIQKTDHSDFDFNGGFFSAAYTEVQEATFTGWRDGVQVYSEKVTLHNDDAYHLVLDWQNIDQVQITSQAGTGYQIAFDDLEFHV